MILVSKYKFKKMKLEEDKFTSKIDRIKSTIEYIQKDIDNIKHECYPEVNPDIDSNYYYDSSVLGNNHQNLTNEESKVAAIKKLSPYKFKDDSNDQPLSKRKNEGSGQNFLKKLNYNYSDSNLMSKIGVINERIPSNNKYPENFEKDKLNNQQNYNSSRINKLHKHVNSNQQQFFHHKGYSGEEESLHEIRNKSSRDNNVKVNKYSKRSNKNQAKDDSNEVKYEYIYKELTSNNQYKVKTGVKTIDLSKDELFDKKVNTNKKENKSKSTSKRNPSTDRPNAYKINKDKFGPVTTKDIQDIERISNLSVGNEGGSEVDSLRDKINYLEKQNFDLKRILTKTNLPIDTKKNYNATSNTITTSYLNGDVGNDDYDGKDYNNFNNFKKQSKYPNNYFNKIQPNTTTNKFDNNYKYNKNKNPFNDNYLQSNQNNQYYTTNNNYEEIVLDTKTIERNVQILIEAQKLLVSSII